MDEIVVGVFGVACGVFIVAVFWWPIFFRGVDSRVVRAGEWMAKVLAIGIYGGLGLGLLAIVVAFIFWLLADVPPWLLFALYGIWLLERILLAVVSQGRRE